MNFVLILPSGLQLYLKQTLTQVFSSKYCEIFKNIFDSTSPLAALVS